MKTVMMMMRISIVLQRSPTSLPYRHRHTPASVLLMWWWSRTITTSRQYTYSISSLIGRRYTLLHLLLTLLLQSCPLTVLIGLILIWDVTGTGSVAGNSYVISSAPRLLLKMILLEACLRNPILPQLYLGPTSHAWVSLFFAKECNVSIFIESSFYFLMLNIIIVNLHADNLHTVFKFFRFLKKLSRSELNLQPHAFIVCSVCPVS